MRHFVIMRYPVLMEDEGRHTFIRVCDSKAEAKAWIAAQVGQYFKPGDYYIAKQRKEES